jgi:hypothetical protein
MKARAMAEKRKVLVAQGRDFNFILDVLPFGSTGITQTAERSIPAYIVSQI